MEPVSEPASSQQQQLGLPEHLPEELPQEEQQLQGEGEKRELEREGEGEEPASKRRREEQDFFQPPQEALQQQESQQQGELEQQEVFQPPQSSQQQHVSPHEQPPPQEHPQSSEGTLPPPQTHQVLPSYPSVDTNVDRQLSNKRDQNWDSQFEALLAYSAKYNHCNVRPGYTVDLDEKVGVNLYAWLALQRRHKKHNKLRPDRLEKLQLLVDSSKLSWTATDNGGRAEDDDEYVHVLPPPPPPSWESHYDALLIHMEKYGTANVPVGHIVSLDGRTKIDLGSWLEDQRKAKLRNSLESLHLRRLDNLARENKFAWHAPNPSAPAPVIPEEVLDDQWQEKFEATKAYVALHPEGCIGDDIDVRLRIEVPPGQQPSNPFDLFQWVRAQRMGHFYQTLKPYRERLLQSLVDQNLFSWMSEDETTRRQRKEIEKNCEEAILWTAWYNALVWLGNNRGECDLNSHGTITLPDGSEAELGKWLHIQKKYIKKGTLAVDRCSKLLQLIQEHKLDRGYWLKYFHLAYPPGTFSVEFPDLFPQQSQLASSMTDTTAISSNGISQPSTVSDDRQSSQEVAQTTGQQQQIQSSDI